MKDDLKQEFSIKQLSLVHEKPVIFILSQWQHVGKPNLFYLIYRWAVALLLLVTMTFSILELGHPNVTAKYRAKWPIYLTHWGYTVCTIQALLVVLMLTICMVTQDLQSNTLKLGQPVYWMTNVMATDIAPVITIIYWSLIHDPDNVKSPVMNFFVHANNSILTMLDLFMVSHPVRLLHCLYSVLFGLSYALFSYVYYVCGGTSQEGYDYIYPILRWSNPGTSVLVCLGVSILLLIVHCFMWGLYKFRVWLHSKCCGEDSESGAQDAENNV